MFELALISTGVLTGLLAGLFGVGGGLIVVPALYFLFPTLHVPADATMHLALGTSLATIVITSLSSAYSHYRHGAVLLKVVFRLAPGLLIGTFIAALLADRLKSNVLLLIFAVFEMLVAIQMIAAFKVQNQRQLPGSLGLAYGGTVIGFVSGLVGIGGGTLTVPYLSWFGTPIKNAVASSAACGFPIALSGMLGFMWVGLDNKSLPPYTTGYVYWPAFLLIGVTSVMFAPLGVKLAHRLTSVWLKRLFALLLIMLSLRMLWKFYF